MHYQNGSQRRVANLLAYLVNCGCQVTVYSFSNHFDCPWGESEIAEFAIKYPTVGLVLDRRPHWLLYWSKAKKLISSLIPSLTPALVATRLPGASPQYNDLRSKFPNALYVVNYANGLFELNGIDPRSTVVETHDLDFLQFTKRYGFALTSRKIVGKFRSEFSLLGIASALIAISRIEAGIFRLFLPDKPVFFVPDYGSIKPKPKIISASRNFDYDLLFVGSDNPLNVMGIVGFIRSHRNLLGRYRLAIAGKASLVDEVVAAVSSSPNVSLLGFVDNIDDLYDRTKIVISPVDGTGLKIKVIEALAAGKPVFGSQHSLEGLPPGAQQCVFPINDANIAKMLTDTTLLASAEKAAEAFARDLSNKGDLRDFRSFLICAEACL
ncbi:MAG: glycosyltransferase family 4 protein [Bradyrhizobium sp.]|nr:glycosyltransferase family 4 protein [Bradyrhizobium sp.]